MGDRDEKIAIGTYVCKDHDKPTNPLTIELKDRSVLRNSEWNKFVKPRLLPCPAHWRQLCEFSFPPSHKKLVIWEAVTPNPHFVALGMVATPTNDSPGAEDLRCVPRSWCVESEMRDKVWEDDEGRGLYVINSLGCLAASAVPYMPPKVTGSVCGPERPAPFRTAGHAREGCE